MFSFRNHKFLVSVGIAAILIIGGGIFSGSSVCREYKRIVRGIHVGPTFNAGELEFSFDDSVIIDSYFLDSGFFSVTAPLFPEGKYQVRHCGRSINGAVRFHVRLDNATFGFVNIFENQDVWNVYPHNYLNSLGLTVYREADSGKGIDFAVLGNVNGATLRIYTNRLEKLGKTFFDWNKDYRIESIALYRDDGNPYSIQNWSMVYRRILNLMNNAAISKGERHD